jgi:hypothetical protein
MKTLNFGTCAALAALNLIASPSAQAAAASLSTTVTRVVVTGNTTFGGCMAALAVSPTTKLATCGANFVTFDCAAVFPTTQAVQAYRMLDQAQLALAGAKSVFVTFTDASKANGYCLATRIDVLK